MPATKPRNQEIATGINKFGRSASYKRSGRWAIKNRSKVVKTVEKKSSKTKTIGGAKNGGSRTVVSKGPKFYPADDVPVRIPNRKQHQHPTAKLRSTITPGTVLILLAGRFRGMRVVFLNQLESGLLLVTGPYKVNGIPLRRVNQAYVVATSTKVDVSGVKVSKFTDAYFQRAEKKATKKSEEGFFSQDKKEKNVIKPERIADQKTVDAALMASIKKVPALKPYLRSRFTLLNGQYPHALKF
eukprot:TRINITY_DN7983_c0_g1::TRINITY_DN7983_c0_g1_i1::g.15510::m.15510 TRINITY_DN7983_c0_g1::TRINITY_DN7983_c0_g1_i1::g.15510  ORF type:complete len:255 (+),score=89.49,sp/P34091/RL6_MESCR/54.66/2e-70,Ribosomal_L6e/PF01159.14/6.8e+03,Ribosomal_L6e/PF01159.14/6.9e-41,Ribosomal_L6e_N/PF03868.10/7.1e-08,Ribosomal_L6e_N/PF03868.10/1.3e+03 TRINITY_DN7983_c0_g1_i1:42-767(+)